MLEKVIADIEKASAPAGGKKRRVSWILGAGLRVGAAGGRVVFHSRPNIRKAAEDSLHFHRRDGACSGGRVRVWREEGLALPAFYIDKTEVTNAAYLRFCNEAHRELPDWFPQDRPDLPVVNVTVLDARDYAHWARKRLPNAREWEKAARGADGRIYPWGNQSDPSKANVGGKGLEPANSFPNGASPFGALHMAGNAWELVDQLSAPGPKALALFQKSLQPPPVPDEPWYSIRGESYRQATLSENVIWDSTTVPARWKFRDIGFRCVAEAR